MEPELEATEKERLNRKLIELLNELRIAIPGVQVLFAFLLILPFNNGFATTTHVQRTVYGASLVCAALASALLIAPAAYHRHRFHRLEEETVDEKQEMIIAQNHLASGGLLVLALAMSGSIYVALEVVLSTPLAAVLAVVLGIVFAWFWYVLPVSRRTRRSGRA
jgi:preprotein translocase subunit SecY